MMRRTGWAIVSIMLLTGFVGAAHALEPDVIQVQLNAPPDKVKQAVEEVLTDSGYTDVVWKDGSTLKTGYREEFESPLLGMYRCCWGVIKSRAKATVTPGAEQTTELRLEVFAEGKRTLWESYAPVKTPYPESSENQLRLIKNKLKIVSHPYTTQSFFKLQ
jgi:hypothetical protein